MEKINSIEGLELRAVNKLDNNKILLVFDNKENLRYEVSFKGYYFETKLQPKNHKVEYASIRRYLGIKENFEVRTHNENIDDYEQLFIKFSSDSFEQKVEIVCAVQDLKIKKYN